MSFKLAETSSCNQPIQSMRSSCDQPIQSMLSSCNEPIQSMLSSLDNSSCTTSVSDNPLDSLTFETFQTSKGKCLKGAFRRKANVEPPQQIKTDDFKNEISAIPVQKETLSPELNNCDQNEMMEVPDNVTVVVPNDFSLKSVAVKNDSNNSNPVAEDESISNSLKTPSSELEEPYSLLEALSMAATLSSPITPEHDAPVTSLTNYTEDTTTSKKSTNVNNVTSGNGIADLITPLSELINQPPSMVSKSPPSMVSKSPPSMVSKSPPSMVSKSPPSMVSNSPPSMVSKSPPSMVSKSPPSMVSKSPPSMCSKSPPSMVSKSPMAKLSKGIKLEKRAKDSSSTSKSLRSDCPPFCKPGCSEQHHELLQAARKITGREGLQQFKEKYATYYCKDSDGLQPRDPIYDPAKDLDIPLLYWMSLMGKVGAVQFLIEQGHDPAQVTMDNKENVLHILAKWFYNFNCTHGWMDALMKRFLQLYDLFEPCLDQSDDDGRTPLHSCAEAVVENSVFLHPENRNPPIRRYKFPQDLMKEMITKSRTHVEKLVGPNIKTEGGNQDFNSACVTLGIMKTTASTEASKLTTMSKTTVNENYLQDDEKKAEPTECLSHEKGLDDQTVDGTGGCSTFSKPKISDNIIAGSGNSSMSQHLNENLISCTENIETLNNNKESCSRITSVLNKLDNNGNTAAHILSRDKGSIGLILLLESLGANLDIVNKEGMSARGQMEKIQDDSHFSSDKIEQENITFEAVRMEPLIIKFKKKTKSEKKGYIKLDKPGEKRKYSTFTVDENGWMSNVVDDVSLTNTPKEEQLDNNQCHSIADTVDTLNAVSSSVSDIGLSKKRKVDVNGSQVMNEIISTKTEQLDGLQDGPVEGSINTRNPNTSSISVESSVNTRDPITSSISNSNISKKPQKPNKANKIKSSHESKNDSNNISKGSGSQLCKLKQLTESAISRLPQQLFKNAVNVEDKNIELSLLKPDLIHPKTTSGVYNVCDFLGASANLLKFATNSKESQNDTVTFRRSPQSTSTNTTHKLLPVMPLVSTQNRYTVNTANSFITTVQQNKVQTSPQIPSTSPQIPLGVVQHKPSEESAAGRKSTNRLIFPGPYNHTQAMQVASGVARHIQPGLVGSAQQQLQQIPNQLRPVLAGSVSQEQQQAGNLVQPRLVSPSLPLQQQQQQQQIARQVQPGFVGSVLSVLQQQQQVSPVIPQMHPLLPVSISNQNTRNTASSSSTNPAMLRSLVQVHPNSFPTNVTSNVPLVSTTHPSQLTINKCPADYPPFSRRTPAEIHAVSNKTPVVYSSCYRRAPAQTSTIVHPIPVTTNQIPASPSARILQGHSLMQIPSHSVISPRNSADPLTRMPSAISENAAIVHGVSVTTIPKSSPVSALSTGSSTTVHPSPLSITKTPAMTMFKVRTVPVTSIRNPTQPMSQTHPSSAINVTIPEKSVPEHFSANIIPQGYSRPLPNISSFAPSQFQNRYTKAFVNITETIKQLRQSSCPTQIRPCLVPNVKSRDESSNLLASVSTSKDPLQHHSYSKKNTYVSTNRKEEETLDNMYPSFVNPRSMPHKNNISCSPDTSNTPESSTSITTRADAKDYIQSPEIVSSSDQHNNPRYNKAPFLSYLQERGSVSDFFEYAKNKRKNIENDLEAETLQLQAVSEEVEDKEKDLKATQDFVKQKEMELELLKAKGDKLQKELNTLHEKRSNSNETCEILTKRIKILEDQSSLFQSLTM